ncbi:hypothetical protein KGV55_02570 [Candidatus Gracilibacteria bacterium]|nr:hypothetical protein [Candidatus Gracilibacteria bacterium]
MDFSQWIDNFQNIRVENGNGILMLAIAIILGLVFLYIIFAAVRTFLAWLYRIDTVIHTQHDTNSILLEILDTLENINMQLQKNTKSIKKMEKKISSSQNDTQSTLLETASKSEKIEEKNSEEK